MRRAWSLIVATACGASGDGPLDPAQDASEHDAAPPDAVPLAAGVDHAVLWQGFDHEWLRTVVGFRVPHRISLLDSYVDEASATGEAGSFAATATWHAGQSTGVDGNFMVPKGYVTALRAPGLWAHAGETHLAWTDHTQDTIIDGENYPRAMSSFTEEVVLGVPAGGRYALALRGLALDMNCRDEAQPPDQPCNSKGMWPYRFAISVRTCTDDGAAGVLRCQVAVEIHRAWTPNLGGVPGFEVKPLNAALDYDLRVLWTAIGGPTDQIALTAAPLHVGTRRGRADGTSSSSPVALGAPGFAQATVALDHLGFTLRRRPDLSDPDHHHLGRYLGQVRFYAGLGGHDPSTGAVTTVATSRVWLPDTVVDAEAEHEVGALVIQHRGDTAQAEVATTLCIPSSDQAPEFSAWDECDDPDKGPARTQDARSIELP